MSRIAIVWASAMLAVSAAAQVPAGGSPFRLPDARVGEYYEYGAVFQGLVEPVEYEWGEAAPPGLETVGPILRGTPTRARPQAYRLRLSAKDALDRPNPSVTVDYELFVRPEIEPLAFCTNSLPTAYFGVPYTQALCAQGGTPPYRFSVTALPGWLRLDPSTRILTGTPDSLNPAGARVTVLDRVGRRTEPVELTLEIAAAPGPGLALRPALLPPALAGQPYQSEIAAEGVHGSLRWSVDWQSGSDWLEIEFDGRVARLSSNGAAEGEAEFTLQAIDADREGSGANELGRVSQAYRIEVLGELPPREEPAWPDWAWWLLGAGLVAAAAAFWIGFVVGRSRERAYQKRWRQQPRMGRSR